MDNERRERDDCLFEFGSAKVQTFLQRTREEKSEEEFVFATNADNRGQEKMFFTNTVRPVGFVGLPIGTSHDTIKGWHG